MLLASLSLLPGCVEEKKEQKVSGDVVKIGIVAPFSGPEREWGDNGLLGGKVIVKTRPYLLNGDKVELLIADNKNDAALTREKVRNLAEIDEVAAILLFADSAATLALGDLVNELKIPVLAALASHPEVTRSEWMSQLIFDDRVQGIVAALYVIDELLVDMVTVFKDIDDPHSVFLAEAFASKFKESGGKVDIVPIAGDDNDYKKILESLDEEKSDFFYLPLTAKQVISIEEQTRALGMKPQVMVGDGLLSQILLQFKDEAKLLDGMLATDIYQTSMPKSGFGKKLVKEYHRSFSKRGTTFTALGAEGVIVITSAMERCIDSNDRSCIRTQLRSGSEFSGLLGKIIIHRNGKTERPVYINLIQDSKLHSLVKIY